VSKAAYTLQGPPHAGATITLSAPGGTVGDLAPTGQGVGLLVSNSGTVNVTVALPVGPFYDGNLGVSTRAVTVPPISGTLPGLALVPLPDSVYGPGTTAVTYSTTANVAVASIRIP
jgi:hypothetical protein